MLASHLVNKYFPPYNAKNIAISVGKGISKEQWAGIERASSVKGMAKLNVEEDLFWLTPGFVYSTIGHEMCWPPILSPIHI